MIPEMAVVPSGGYRFQQRLPSGGFQQFVGVSNDDLFRQVRTFRLNNNIELGDLEVEIKQGISGPAHKAYNPQYSLRERVTGWKSNRMYQKIKFVDPELATHRADICQDCPYNNLKYADDCIECFSHTNQDLYAMRQGRTTDQDEWLGACEICGHDNKTAVHLSGTNLQHKVNYETQLREKKPNCWLLDMDSDTEVES
jgi:hypothetical protein